MKSLGRLRIFVFIVVITLVFFLFKTLYLERPDTVDMSKLEPAYRLEAKTIIGLTQNVADNFIAAEQVVEIQGVIRGINYDNNRATILLGTGDDPSSYVICDMQNSQKEKMAKLNIKDTIKLKGVFKGFLEDAIFLNCIISNRKYE